MALPGSNPPTTRRGRLLLVFLVIPLVIVLSAASTFGWSWYRWATAGESPYDEIGIEVNSRLPGPLRGWACARIAARFPGTIPPYSCGRR